jgi:hypothetical protein
VCGGGEGEGRTWAALSERVTIAERRIAAGALTGWLYVPRSCNDACGVRRPVLLRLDAGL